MYLLHTPPPTQPPASPFHSFYAFGLDLNSPWEEKSFFFKPGPPFRAAVLDCRQRFQADLRRALKMQPEKVHARTRRWMTPVAGSRTPGASAAAGTLTLPFFSPSLKPVSTNLFCPFLEGCKFCADVCVCVQM